MNSQKPTSSETKPRFFTGRVVSTKMKNTAVVVLEYKYAHHKYRKILTKKHKIYVENTIGVQVDDIVKVKETKPISKLKRFVTVSKL